MSTNTRQSVLITGCSPGGIGHALAIEFHSRGYRVLATARNASHITSLSDLGIETLSLTVDDHESVAACFSEVSKLLRSNSGSGGLNYLINNAGKGYTCPATDLDMAEVASLFETNLFAVMNMCKTFTPLLIAAQGTIVQIGSVAGILPYVWGSAYSASKAALHAYSDTLRVELRPFGVHVVVAVTGGVKSNIARTKRELGEDSLYRPLQKEWEARLVQSQTMGIQTEVYAKSLVNQVLATRQGWFGLRNSVWVGNGSGISWFINAFLPVGTKEGLFYWMFNLGKLAPDGGQSSGIAGKAFQVLLDVTGFSKMRIGSSVEEKKDV
ncbi:hypothetical protein MMC25_004477 [Agyrium rufum]|nr:hypothetical protein [Agyrium rufum]